MKLSILLRTKDFRGDHDAEVSIAFGQKENETLGDLVNRLKLNNEVDWIEIRLVRVTKEG